MNKIQQSIIQLAQQNTDVAIVWLYGSRAKSTATINSDYDLAVAFKSFIKNNPLENRLRPECLTLDWQQALGLHDFQLSIIDINQVPILLAWQVIKANQVLYCADEWRLWQETQRIQSRMEIDFIRPIKKQPLQLWN
jgi:uncharacterized protein